VPDDVWTGTAAEQQCMKHQLAVMEHIGATKGEIDYAKNAGRRAITRQKTGLGKLRPSLNLNPLQQLCASNSYAAVAGL